MYRFVILLFFSAVHAQLEINGTCDLTNINHHTVVSDKIAGKWYQIERIPNSVEKGDCSHTTLTIEIDNSTLVWSGNKYDSEVVDGKLALRNATIMNTSELGVWNVTYHDGISQAVVILGTDNTEYLMLYSCQNNGNTSATISAWKLGRNTTYSLSAKNATNTLAANANIANTTWKVVSHSEAACKLKGGATNLQLSPLLFLLLALGLAKDI
ncbi:apolipoprotein D-like [Maniola jurtina]|uniref:apolipoprotein D-like n=1 Tax=Maniola jurtina TaxID=191418 RepID=UPI001E688D28|nr:apolipoprotein D-like [Maniola jurtina]